MYELDHAWAAGFFDAEGCFARAGPTPVATASQVDMEPLDVFFNTVAVGSLHGPYKRATRQIYRREQWVYYAYGRNAAAVFEMIKPWLGRYRTLWPEKKGPMGLHRQRIREDASDPRHTVALAL